MIKINKKDILWGYFAEFFSLASGLITLPLILRMLSPEEIGVNYIMLTVGSIVSLFDFGFGTQFGRNVTYIFSGVNTLKKEEVDNLNSEGVNYKLLATMIKTAQFVYKRISIIVLLILLVFGTFYMSRITNNFSAVKNSLLVWIVYSCSTFFNIYYTYYMSLLIGKGLIKESRIAMVASRFASIFFTVTLLYLGFGLLAVALANFIAPFVSRYLSYQYFFSDDLKEEIKPYIVTKSEINELFQVIWYNARKIGLITVAASSLTYLTTFIVGLFLSLSEVASFGLMIQLTGLICVISMSLFNSMLPNISYLYINKEMEGFKNRLGLSLVVFYGLFIVGSLFLIYFVPYLLKIIGSKTVLPSVFVLIVFLGFNFFEKNQTLFSQVLLLENKVPFMNAAILTGIIATVSIFVALYFKVGIQGVVIAQAIPTLAYSAWKWPLVALNKFNISFYKDIIVRGGSQIINFKQNA
jgi:O-antigen/teichoic acid export membrane protein